MIREINIIFYYDGLKKKEFPRLTLHWNFLFKKKTFLGIFFNSIKATMIVLDELCLDGLRHNLQVLTFSLH